MRPGRCMEMGSDDSVKRPQRFGIKVIQKIPKQTEIEADASGKSKGLS